MSDVPLLLRGRVRTLDRGQAHAEAVLVRGRRIAAVGAFAELRSQAPDARLLDFGEALVLPGLVDGHAHLTSLGRALASVRLDGSRDLADVVARCRAWAAANPEGWVVGRGWDQTIWPGSEAFPDRATLDAAFPERPACLVRIDGHAAFVNAAALRASGVRDDAADPVGGRLLRRADGTLTGVLVDMAMPLVTAHVPPASLAQRRRWIEAACTHALALGLTGVHDAAVSVDADEAFRSLAADDTLSLRVHGLADLSEPAGLDLVARGPLAEQNRYALTAVKLFSDGALGSRGALLFKPYCDDPTHAGLAVQDLPELEAKALAAAEAGFQIGVHAIGDRANARVLDLYESLLRRGLRLRRPRIEHAQILRRSDIPRFRLLGVAASVQPVHATSDRHQAARRLGDDRLAGAYAYRSLLDAGAVVAFGSDFPVEGADPQAGLRAAVLRQDADGEPPEGWRRTEAVTPDEAWHAFTRANAWASGRESELGVLRRGALADVTVLSSDPFGSGGGFQRAAVLATLVDGGVRYLA